jgi:hypothetical protein
MARVKPFEYNPDAWSAAFWDNSWGYPWQPSDWIAVHEYSNADLMYMLTWSGIANLPDQPTAALAARYLASHPDLLNDLSPITHGSYWQGFNCPVVPRHNIYRRGHGQRMCPVFYWDWWNLGPPPGY